MFEEEFKGLMAFFASPTNLDLFVPKNQEERDFVNKAVKFMDTSLDHEIPHRFRYKYDLDNFSYKDICNVRSKECVQLPKMIQTFSSFGRTGTLRGLLNLYVFILKEKENFSDAEFATGALFIQSEIFQALAEMCFASTLGGDFRLDVGKVMRLERQGSPFVGITGNTKRHYFERKIDGFFFEIYKSIFLKQKAPLHQQILEQNNVLAEIETLEKQMANEMKNLPKLKSCVPLIASIIFIIKKQSLLTENLLYLAEQHDIQLIFEQHRFLETKFREMSLLLAHQLIKCSLVVGLEGIRSVFALSEGGLMLILSPIGFCV